MVSKKIREEAYDYVANGYLRQALDNSGMSREAIDYIIDAVKIYRNW